jgi:hypothetical protein
MGCNICGSCIQAGGYVTCKPETRSRSTAATVASPTCPNSEGTGAEKADGTAPGTLSHGRWVGGSLCMVGHYMLAGSLLLVPVYYSLCVSCSYATHFP